MTKIERVHRGGTLLLALTLVAVATTPARAQDESSYPTVSMGANMGFQKLSSSNGLYEFGFDLPIHLTEHFAIGPWMQVGFGQEAVNLIFTANIRYSFDFLRRTRFNRVEPFVQGGAGLVYTKINGAKATDFTMNMGFGAEVPVSDHVYIGSDVMFNPILTRNAGNNWAFSWQFVTLRYRF